MATNSWSAPPKSTCSTPRATPRAASASGCPPSANSSPATSSFATVLAAPIFRVLEADRPPLALPDKGDVQGGRLQQRLAERHAALDARGVARRQALRYPPAKSEPVRLYPGGREEH